METVRPLMKPEEVAKHLNISPKSINRLIYSGYLKPAAVKVGGQWRFHADELKKILRPKSHA